ncbi:hypothetical protein J4219_04075 [Candidatus Woesearchaeota archaeon]|nr:hypothetical protein [Candidatus Woesearchaeota archaeon]
MSLKKAKEFLKNATIAAALSLGITSTSKAQETPAPDVHAHASAHGFAGDTQGFGASLDLRDNDLGIRIDYAGSREYPLREEFASAEINLYDIYAGGGALGEKWGAYAAYRPDFRLGNDTIALNTTLNLSVGYGNDNYDTQALTSKLYAAGLGARLELDINPCSFINTKIGAFIEGFSAVPDDIAYQPRDINNKKHRYEYLSTILSLSEARAGAYAEINAALYQDKDSITLLTLRHIAENVQWDLSVPALPNLEIDYFEDFDIEPYAIRHITRAEITHERRFGPLHFLVGLFAQHTMGSRTFETPLHRNGFSTGATLLLDYGIADLRLEGEIYSASQLREYTRKEPRASMLAELGLSFGGEENALRAFTGIAINRSRDAFTGLAQEGTLFYAGLAYEFGASRCRYDAVDNANIVRSTSERQLYAAWQAQNAPPQSNEPNYGAIVRERPTTPITITRDEAQTLLDVFRGKKPFNDAKTVITRNSDLNRIIDVDALENIYNLTGNLDEGPTREGIQDNLLESDMLVGYSQENTTVNIFNNAAREDLEHTVEDGIVLSITPNKSARELMASQRNSRATLVLGRDIYTLRAPSTEAFMRLLGYRSLVSDLTEPRFEFRLR